MRAWPLTSGRERPTFVHPRMRPKTRLIILDHFMLDGVKALFKFTMAILYLAFQVSPPSSCEVFAAIRNTARDLYDIKLLLSIVDQIRLPKDSYFAIRRSFYMVQSSFNSDQFYIQTLSSEANRRGPASASLPLSMQQQADTKPPAVSSFGRARESAAHGRPLDPSCTSSAVSLAGGQCAQQARVLSSQDRSKVCIQNLGKLGRSHLKIMDSNVRSNERSLMAPLRNCLCIGLSNCGKQLVLARQASRRQFRSFKEQDLSLHVHELPSELFDGFYLEQLGFSVLVTHSGELLKLAHTLEQTTSSAQCSRASRHKAARSPSPTVAPCETLMLRDCCSSIGEHEKIKLRQASLDPVSNLLWLYVDSEEIQESTPKDGSNPARRRFNYNNPFNERRQDGNNQSSSNTDLLLEARATSAGSGPDRRTRLETHAKTASSQHELGQGALARVRSGNRIQLTTGSSVQQASALLRQRKILIIDLISFDIFSAFTIPASFGEIGKLRASLVAYFQLANPTSSQFSSRIVQIGPNGHYEQLLSFSDMVDYMVNVPESFRRKFQLEQQHQQQSRRDQKQVDGQQKYSSLKRLLTHSISFSSHASPQTAQVVASAPEPKGCQQSTLSRYYKSFMRSYSVVVDPSEGRQEVEAKVTADQGDDRNRDRDQTANKLIKHNALRSIISSKLSGDFSELSENNYIPVNMAFIFRNGKIALFEFTESYAIHTRESQLDRYDYSHVLDVVKSGDDFIVTILTVFDKIIKIII